MLLTVQRMRIRSGFDQQLHRFDLTVLRRFMKGSAMSIVKAIHIRPLIEKNLQPRDIAGSSRLTQILRQRRECGQNGKQQKSGEP